MGSTCSARRLGAASKQAVKEQPEGSSPSHDHMGIGPLECECADTCKGLQRILWIAQGLRAILLGHMSMQASFARMPRPWHQAGSNKWVDLAEMQEPMRCTMAHPACQEAD